MGLRLATTARNAAADAVVDLLDAGAGAATLKIYSGSQPTDPQTTASGTLLATVTLVDPAFGSASTGTATGSDPASVNASATGTAGWYRTADSNGNAVWDGSVGISTSVTGTASTDTLTTSSAHGLSVGNVVNMASGITGISAGWYVVIAVPTSTTFKIATYGSSTAVDITADSSATYSTADLVLSSTSLTSGSPVDITSLIYAQPQGS